MFDLNRVLFFILPSIAGVFFVLWFLKDYFYRLGSDQSRKNSSAEESDERSDDVENEGEEVTKDIDGQLVRKKHAENLARQHQSRRQHRRRQRNPFRHIFSQDPSDSRNGNGSRSDAVGTVLPHILQRRHSTVFPLQMAKAAKNLWRNRGIYKRQMSEVARDVFPQPPSEFFEPSAIPEVSEEFKPMFYIHHNVKLLELPSSWILDPNEIEVLEFEANEIIIRPGDNDDAMFVVLEGALSVYIALPEGKECLVKHIEQGYSFFSLLSLIDILMRIPSTLRTVSLKARQRSRVARYSFRRFQEAYEREPSIWLRPLQIIVTRLLHVTLTPLHQHLGLGEELFKRKLDERNLDDRARSFGNAFKFGSKSRATRQMRLSSTETSTGEATTLAIRWFGELLRISQADAHNLLASRIEIVCYDEGQTVAEQGELDLALLLVLSGALQISQEVDTDDLADNDETPWTTCIYPKELVGGLELLSNEPTFFTLKAIGPVTKVARITKSDFDQIIEEMPAVLLPVAYSVVRRVSPFVRAVDFAIDWILTDSGQAVYRSGDLADSVYVVLSGRLRSVTNKTVIEEYGRDDVVGILEMLQRQPRSTTVLAVRFSQLARVPEGVLNFVKMQFPQVGFRLVRLLGQYYNENRRGGTLQLQTASVNDPISTTKNLRTIAIFPAALDVPLIAFSCELYHALNTSTRVLRLSSKKVAKNLGESVLEKQADFRLMKWLNAQEDNFQLVIYECDYTATNWTRRCLRQADAIFVVANGDVEPPEQQFIDDHLKMNQDGIRTRKELVLLWDEAAEAPHGTYNWLKGSWFSGHYHIRAPKRMYQWQPRIDKEEDEIMEFYETKVFFGKADFYNDFSRLGRILTGNAVGLVLGGGGARGAAHVGVIKALQEHGIPVDIVGGTSIGSLIGGIFAGEQNQNVDCWKAKARFWFMTMSSLWRKLWDLTYAHSAMFTGAGFNQTIQDAFGERFVEDLWIPYFCISTDISVSEMRVHRAGPLWAYCRASMSLAGYLPPLCDPLDGHLLLDGGYVNNLPADVMRSLGAKCVIAVDVGAAPETELYNYGDSLSGFWVLLRKLNPWAEPIRILGMEEIQSRLAFVSCVRQLELVKKASYCHYLRPPIEVYRTLDFAKFDEIYDIGYVYASEKLSELVKTNTNIKSVMNPEKLRSALTRMKSVRGRGEINSSLHNSFTDLAAQISRIPIRHHGSLRSLNDIGEDSIRGSDADFEDGDESSDWYNDDEDAAMNAIAMAAGWRPPSTRPTSRTLSANDFDEYLRRSSNATQIADEQNLVRPSSSATVVAQTTNVKVPDDASDSEISITSVSSVLELDVEQVGARSDSTNETVNKEIEKGGSEKRTS